MYLKKSNKDLLICKAIGCVLVYKVHNVFSEVCHVFGEGEAQMAKRVGLVPNELATDFLTQPNVVFGGRQIIVLTDEQAYWNR